ncbi:MAG TPA: VWA domain-containing protein [Mycobacteriales bacterium]|nr:VWA domain-containing protein [Mycobacteriales bacterium]
MRSPRGGTPAVLVVGLALAATGATATPAHALSPAKVTPGSLELVLDASGSMAGPDPSGGTKIDAARRAITGMLGALPSSTPVAVRAYGGTYEDRERGCSDTRLVVPVGPARASAATAALAGLQPTGYTPIAASLRAAAADLPASGPRTIVLVSDGEETCGGDPCAVARELAGAGVGLRVDTVGYGVDERTRTQLGCVAAATGGQYTEAPDGDALTVQLAAAADTGLRSYQPTGTRVTGTVDPFDAPVLAPGQFVDALDPGERSYYAIDLADGVSPYLAGTLVHPVGPVAGSSFDNLTVAVYGLDGRKCGQVSDSTSQSYGGTAATTVAAPGAVGGKWTSTFSSAAGNCGPAGRYTFSVERDAYGKGQAALPLELRVLLEPPPTDRSSLPAADVALPAALPAPVLRSPLTPVAGGGSFSTAAQLRPGSSADTIRPGETLFYRVPVGWGQRLAYTATVPPIQAGDGASLPSTSLRSYVANPTRQKVKLLSGATDTAYYSGVYDDDGATVGGSTAPVVFRNRDVSEDALQTEALAGDHYILVQLAATKDSDTAVPLRLAVDVVGPQTGTVDYGTASGAQDPTVPDSTVGEPAQDETTQDGSGEGSGQEAAGTSRTETSTDGVPWQTVGYTGGGVAALALAGALLLLPTLRSRRHRPQR